jgi:polyisoprenoid-binding protein YceI
MQLIGRVFSVFVLSFCATASQAAPVDSAASEVKATFRQLGVPVSGQFRRLRGDVDFDPKKPAAATARLEIDVDSFDLGDKDYNAEVAKKEWFDAKRHPKATFVLSKVTAQAGGGLGADGSLSIKGLTVAVRIPVTLTQKGAVTVFEGKLPVSRLAFAIGEGEWKDTGLVADEVIIAFRIATAVPGGTEKK